MVPLIKNKIASVEDVAHLPAGRVAKRCTQSLRNAVVPRAKSLPHINLVAEGRSLKASLKHRVETARRPGGSISAEPASPTTASTVGSSSPMISSSSPVVSDAACSDQWEEDEDHCHRLVAVAQSWLDFEQLVPQCCAGSDQTIEQARRDFCHDPVQSFPGCSPIPSSLQVDRRSSNPADPVSLPSVSSPHLSSQAPSVTSLTGQTTVTSTVAAKPARSPEFSDEESQRESDNFSFHFSQDEEWTDEVEARMQNAIDRMLEDARRQLAVPVLNFSVLFPDDLLADSVAHQTAANPRTSRSGASSLEDYNGSYSVDPEDEREEDDDVESMVEDIGYGIDNVWEELAIVPARLLTPISEETLADDKFNSR
ncbi:hypothetical protein JVT61DRAFT_7388 [Boletus reticuloceps]|uniref:Uncharacterized protein n=1 Tax=Boletus reticuloceps TaxID=495285 RepID=A0A8I3A739_9AGAM|nr:hypothetical protein JVT61DRAFT_7388 [Boletus reticuloceps]